NLNQIPSIRVLNKKDLLDQAYVHNLIKMVGGTAISAKSKKTLMPLIEQMEKRIEQINRLTSF
ncbi:MAG: hypothetical protein KJO61_09815, partial [Deltaproteobacteria bacterium]|nr:hypothetical protein [Deltaproteobacteria bacterium]